MKPKETPSRFTGGTAIAELTGLSKQHVSILLKKGHSPGEIILEQELKRGADRTGASSGKSESFIEARTRKESILGDLRALQLQRERAELVPRAEMLAYLAGAITASKDILLRLPDWSDRFALETDPTEIRVETQNEVHRALQELQAGWRKLAENSVPPIALGPSAESQQSKKEEL
jgi:transcriptional regulator with XRE-family HTH domain